MVSVLLTQYKIQYKGVEIHCTLLEIVQKHLYLFVAGLRELILLQYCYCVTCVG